MDYFPGIRRIAADGLQVGWIVYGLYEIPAQKCYKKCGFEIADTVIREMANGKNINRIKMEVML